ncbi:phage tail tape measure protein [Pseudomonas plecoglossicida]|uniref:Phage tail tape measure protein n=1 Tax=Pseudomonas plecoglossicida TaxID=70775 RepID=A0A0B5K9Z4_PSEDL|nr:phage tail tape measure protein [Pseudomonas plecoglossicida]AJG17338.1 lambda family phage tail tape measure protein [Pseudomonas plecoglossicida]PBJ97557.1 phage tail tape measure protein [Pseudomonas plecoglossicida]
MASRSLGTLTLDLIAKIGGFTGPLDKAGRETQKQMAEIKKSAERLGTAVGTVFATIPAAVAGLVASSAAAAKEISNLSSLAGLSTTEFQRYAAAASSVGLQQDKLSDIFKDTNDKVGDFLATGGGELKNFFETIAPKVGVTAEQFRKLNSAEALQLYVSSLQKANVNQAQMTFFMEAIADEATALVPLLADGGKKFRELGDSAEAAGMVLDGTTIAAALEFNNQLTTIGQYANAAKTALAAEFMPVLAQLAKDLADTTKEAGGLQKSIRDFSDDLIEVGAMAASTGDGIGRAFRTVAISMAGTFATTMAYIQSIGATANLVLSKVTFGDLSADFKKNSDQMSADAKDSARAANTIFLELGETMNKAWAGDSIREYVKQARKAAADVPKLEMPGAGKPGVLGLTDAQKAAAKAAEAAQKKINQAFQTTEENYQRQIALINTEVDKRKDATEVAKLQFELESGKLHGLSAQQQDRLKGLAAELDHLKQIKQQNEDAKKLAAFRANVGEDYQTARSGFDQELAGAGRGDKYKERLKERLAIEEGFNRQQRELVLQRNSGDISQGLYDQETQLLSDALAARLELQNDYYSQLDEAQSNWMDGVTSAWENFADAATDYSAMAADATTSVLGSARSELGSFLSDVATGSKDAGDALMDMVGGFARSMVDALADMAAQWLVYQAVQLMVGKTTQASAAPTLIANAQATSFQAQLAAFASTAAIPIVGPALAPGAAIAAAMATAPLVAGVASSALVGMAHDGIDSVPREGTWLLQKGERVTTANTSAKLDKTLDEVSKGSKGSQPEGTGQPVAVHQVFHVNGDVSPQTVAMIQQGMRQTMSAILQDVGRNGQIMQSIRKKL